MYNKKDSTIRKEFLMKYIFLDIDGVLNTRKSWFKMYQLDKTLVSRLAVLVNTTGAKIVLTSSWRKGWDVENQTPQIKKLLDYFQAVGIFVEDVTPVLNGRGRDDEINRYLYFHPCDTYIVIDDDKNEFQNTTNVYFVNADNGLTEKDIKNLVKLLK